MDVDRLRMTCRRKSSGRTQEFRTHGYRPGIASMYLAAAPHAQAHIPGRLRQRDRWRRRLVAACFRRLLKHTDQQLCMPGQLPVRGIHRVLVCRPNHRLGNTVLISPLLAEIEALYPGAEIDVVSGGSIGEHLFAGCIHVRRIYSLPRKIARHLWTTVKLLGQLRRDTYDLAIDACIDSQSGRLLLAITKARFKLGYPDEQSPAAAAWHDLPRPEHLAKRSVFLLRTAYAGEVSRPYPPLRLRLQKAEKDQGREVLDAVLGEPEQTAHPHMVVGVFANATGAKCYRTDWWSQFIGKLLAQQPDVRIVNLLAEHGESQLDERLASYYTRDPRRLAAMIACMDAFISADCGVMHLAAATGTPTMGLFSTSSSAKYGPYGGSNTSVDTRDLGAADVAAIAADWLKATTAKPLHDNMACGKA